MIFGSLAEIPTNEYIRTYKTKRGNSVKNGAFKCAILSLIIDFSLFHLNNIFIVFCGF